MQSDRQENQNNHESRSAWWSRSADAFADFDYRYQTIIKVALVVFERNEKGNAFWEKQGFTVRNDLIYRNLSLVELTRIDT